MTKWKWQSLNVASSTVNSLHLRSRVGQKGAELIGDEARFLIAVSVNDSRVIRVNEFWQVRSAGDDCEALEVDTVCRYCLQSSSPHVVLINSRVDSTVMVRFITRQAPCERNTMKQNSIDN